jgi:hypothetical protein
VPRSPNAPLSPAELAALRRVDSGLVDLSSSHRTLLLSMGLIRVTVQGSLALTEAGRTRLAGGTARQSPIKDTQPPAD